MTRKPVRLLRHPVILAALALWLVNDHVLKGRGPGWLTGKLSDVACLVVVPALFVGVVEFWQLCGGRSFVPRCELLIGAFVATGLAMATINIFDPAAWAYRNGLGALQWPLRQLVALPRGELAPWRPVRLWMDPTDLWTLPALAVPWLVSHRHFPRPPSGG